MIDDQTGLDPESRRDIWTTVKKMQTSMTILLTTHSMEEADVLCSRISILTSDGLQCFGSQIHLKNKYGKQEKQREVRIRGFLLSFAFNQSISDKDAFVKSSLSPYLEFVEEKYGMSTYKVDKKMVDLGEILKKITNLQDKGVILKWSVAQSSLDDVFLKLCRDHEREQHCLLKETTLTKALKQG